MFILTALTAWPPSSGVAVVVTPNTSEILHRAASPQPTFCFIRLFDLCQSDR